MRRNQYSASTVPAPQPAQPPIDLSVVLVTGGYDHEIRFWEAWSGICSRTIPRTGESGQVNRIAISPDKHFIAAAIHKKVAIYDITSPSNSPINVCEGHTQNVTSISYHADGKWFVTGSEDGTIRIWDMRSNQAHRTYDNQSPVNDVLIHPNQGELISADQNGNIKQWVLSTNECDLELAPEADVPMRSITMAHDGSFLIAANHEGNCFVWRVTDDPNPQTRFKAVHKFKAHTTYLTRCVLSPDSHLLATCSADTTIKLWQIENNYTASFKKQLTGHQRWVWDAAFSADSAYLVSASSDHVARLWDLEKGETLRQYNGHHKAVTTSSFSPTPYRFREVDLRLVLDLFRCLAPDLAHHEETASTVVNVIETSIGTHREKGSVTSVSDMIVRMTGMNDDATGVTMTAIGGAEGILGAGVKARNEGKAGEYLEKDSRRHRQLTSSSHSRHDKSKERKERKAEKKRQKDEEQLRQLAELSVYNPVDNPFHDANLSQQFKWHKKLEKDKKSGLSAAEAQARDIARRQEAREELERLNRRRAEREAEMALREEEEAKMARLQESAQMAEWIAKEGDFQLDQERKRSIIRLKERRAKAIDFLSLNLKYVSPNGQQDDEDGLDAAGLDIDLDEPYIILDSLNLAQVEELHDDIQRYLSLEEDPVHTDFWTNMMVVCKARLDDLRQQASDKRRGMSTDRSVEASITTLLEDKTHEQLSELQRSVQAKLSSGDPIDVDYWEGLLKSLVVWKSKAKLRTLHEIVVRNRLEQLRKRQRDEALQAQVELLGGGRVHQKEHWPAEVEPLASQKDGIESAAMEVDETEPYARDMSPPLFVAGRLSYEDRQLTVIKPVDDLRTLIAQRRAVAATRFVPKTVEEQVAEEPVAEAPMVVDAFTRELNYRMDAEADLDEDDEELVFSGEADLAQPTTYTWEDKYRPRKPRYLNRVHTGYEWNKYNQTHYDTDNPPPKVVQGYKFNIFYPDLIDKSKTPTYKLVKDGSNDDTILLVFQAGPPYEDIAFKIVNRDWEHSHKRGFKSTFDRGCLSLWFNFRRNFYRK